MHLDVGEQEQLFAVLTIYEALFDSLLFLGLLFCVAPSVFLNCIWGDFSGLVLFAVSLVGIYFIDRLAALFWKDPAEKKV